MKLNTDDAMVQRAVKLHIEQFIDAILHALKAGELVLHQHCADCPVWREEREKKG
ncbi:hypothetical protein J9N36_003195 [Salmonella enterica]|nr:hypothetical protein [Salmonella enterica]